MTPDMPALPGAPAAATPSKPSVTITDMGDGTFTVVSGDEATESPDMQQGEPSESGAPIKGIDAALMQAKTMLAGEAPEPAEQDQQAVYDAQFK